MSVFSALSNTSWPSTRSAFQRGVSASKGRMLSAGRLFHAADSSSAGATICTGSPPAGGPTSALSQSATSCESTSCGGASNPTSPSAAPVSQYCVKLCHEMSSGTVGKGAARAYTQRAVSRASAGGLASTASMASSGAAAGAGGADPGCSSSGTSCTASAYGTPSSEG